MANIEKFQTFDLVAQCIDFAENMRFYCLFKRKS